MLHQIERIDWSVLKFIDGNCHNAVTDTVFPFITYLGEGGAVWLLLALGFILFGKKSGWRSTGWAMVLAMLAGLLIGELALKNIICRPRPFEYISSGMRLLIPFPSGYSFPSGHSCSSFAAAVVIFRRDKRWGPGAGRADCLFPGVPVCPLPLRRAGGGAAGRAVRIGRRGSVPESGQVLGEPGRSREKMKGPSGGWVLVWGALWGREAAGCQALAAEAAAACGNA